MKSHTVLLLYPDYMANDFGKDSYCWMGDARDTFSAVQIAREQCEEESNTSEGLSSFESLEDLHVLIAGEGVLKNVTWE